MAYVTRNGVRRPRPTNKTNGVQRLVKLEGTVATFECLKGHRMTKDYSKGLRSRQMSAEALRRFSGYWGLGTQSNGSKGHVYGWCQKCQNEADAGRA